jgi:hypothetical protein
LAKDSVIIYHGLYGFKAVLTGIALGGRPGWLAGPLRFLLLNWRSTIYALIGTIFSVIVFAAIAVALSPDRHASVDRSARAHDLAILLPTASFKALQRPRSRRSVRPELTRAE